MCMAGGMIVGSQILHQEEASSCGWKPPQLMGLQAVGMPHTPLWLQDCSSCDLPVAGGVLGTPASEGWHDLWSPSHRGAWGLA